MTPKKKSLFMSIEIVLYLRFDWPKTINSEKLNSSSLLKIKMPKIQKAKYWDYSSEDLSAAAAEFKAGVKVSDLSRKFNVPYQILHYKLNKNSLGNI